MSSEKKIGIIGNGGQADEAHSYSLNEVGFRAVDVQYVPDNNEYSLVDIQNPNDEQREMPVHIAIGAPALRSELAKRWPGDKYETIISKDAYIDKSAEIGEGSLIGPRSVITTNVKLGRHVIVNVAATIQHDTSVGDFSTIGPGVNIGGHVSIGEGVFVGIGANIINNVSVADGVVIGAGATLTRSADIENGVYVGTPAVFIKKNEGWLNEI